MLRVLASSFFILAMATQPMHAASRPVVVELFTSEGCSSCPPADALLTELAGRADVLPLAFHVTYWNALGWRDPFSMEAATVRQAAYAAALGGGSYTPQMVVDGRRGMVGSDRAEVASAIAASRDTATRAVSVGLSAGARDVSIAVGAGGATARVLLVGFDRQHSTTVGRGENSGRTLVESNVVRSIKIVGSYDGTAAEFRTARGAGELSAAIVQAPNGEIVGAALN